VDLSARAQGPTALDAVKKLLRTNRLTKKKNDIVFLKWTNPALKEFLGSATRANMGTDLVFSNTLPCVAGLNFEKVVHNCVTHGLLQPFFAHSQRPNTKAFDLILWKGERERERDDERADEADEADEDVRVDERVDDDDVRVVVDGVRVDEDGVVRVDSELKFARCSRSKPRRKGKKDKRLVVDSSVQVSHLVAEKSSGKLIGFYYPGTGRNDNLLDIYYVEDDEKLRVGFDALEGLRGRRMRWKHSGDPEDARAVWNPLAKSIGWTWLATIQIPADDEAAAAAA